MTILAHLMVQEARRLAKDGVLNDPTDDELILAVLDLVAPNTEVRVTEEMRRMVVREYDHCCL